MSLLQQQQQQQQYSSFKQASEHRLVLYCEQHPDPSDDLLQCQSTQLIPTLEHFLTSHPHWHQHLAIANITPSSSPTTKQQTSPSDVSPLAKSVPFYHHSHPEPSLVTRADICILLMNSDKQQKWLKDAHRLCANNNNHSTNGNPPTPKHVILVDPSKPLLPPSPPLLPVDEYKVTTIQHVDQIPSTVHSILSSLHVGDKLVVEAAPSHPQPLIANQVIQEYQGAKKQRLFLFDYDGTLTPIVSRPEMALPTRSLLDYLTALCRDPLNTVWIVSGRDQKFLHDCFGHLQTLGLSAEHGSFMKMPGESNWIDMLKDAVLPWKPEALDIFSSFTNGLPGTEIEQKKSSITWHYRNAHDLDVAVRKSHECHQALLGLPGVDILVGKMNLEVRSVLVNKGNVVKRIRQQQGGDNAVDFVMCAGDDQTDEDMFRALFHDTKAHTILVGPPTKLTLARFCLDTSQQVVDLLGQLVSSPHHKQSSSL